jgi:ubiquitin carboxyl-terminal hydrolase 7
MKSYIKCVNVDYESVRIEEFNGVSLFRIQFYIFNANSDIQLNVKGLKNLYESFKDYVAVDILSGENKYPAEGLGLQDAQKGIIFESFPPVLHLQLKRYRYDMQRHSMVKLNDRHEFPFEIDLGEFLNSSADRSKPWIYSLHGVVVHDGDLHGGHYSTYIKPDRDTRWLRFDDDKVTPATDKQALEENYGGKVRPPRSQGEATKPFPNAYMLVYIRKSAMDDVLAPFSVNDIPPHISTLDLAYLSALILICSV